MRDKERRRKIKRIQKEIDRLKKEMNKIELIPCHGDAELRRKDEDLRILKREIYDLERDANVISLRFGI